MAEEVKEEKKEVAKAHTNMVADLSNGIYSSSDTFTLSCQMAKGLAASTLVPQAYQRNEANCLVALEMANRTNQSPLQVMQSLDVIQGTPSWRGKALIAMINASHKYDEDLNFEYTKDKDGSVKGCIAWTTKNGKEVRGTEYTYKMAEQAGLFKKTNSYWNKEPELMLAYRATSRFCSLNCPEISLGLYTVDEQKEIEGYYKDSKSASLNDVLNEDIYVESVQTKKEDADA